MKLFNGGPILFGLVVFLVLASLPFWYNAAFGTSTTRPELELPDRSVHPKCVAATEYMRNSHMELLNEWRDVVVRTGDRTYTDPDGKKYDMSLTLTCLNCHTSKKNFCDRCHEYLGVRPYCWDCHVVPEGD